MKQVLKHPAIYQLYQQMGGFFGARVVAIGDHLQIRPGARVFDIGCGPGHIVRHLPAGIDYIGFDIDHSSIDYARTHFGDRGRFEAQSFDSHAARDFGCADVIMMNGVMHHIGDRDLVATLSHIHAALRPGGVLFTLDGCYQSGQGWFERWLLDNDRGQHVRQASEYKRLLGTAFSRVEMHVRNKLSRLPYTFAIGVAQA